MRRGTSPSYAWITMRSQRVLSRMRAVLATLALSAAPVAAQRPAGNGTQLTGSVFHLTPYIGYMVFGHYLDGPFGTSVSNAPSAVYGAQAALSLTPNLSLVGNVGYTESKVQAGIPFLGGVSIANSSMVLYDGDLQLDMPLHTATGLSLVPFIQGGVGGMHYDISESVLKTTANNLAGNVGVGADVALGRGMALRLLAKDYFGKFDFQQATSFDVSSRLAHNLAFTAGVRLDF
jgi:hypothetical protein